MIGFIDQALSPHFVMALFREVFDFEIFSIAIAFNWKNTVKPDELRTLTTPVGIYNAS